MSACVEEPKFDFGRRLKGACWVRPLPFFAHEPRSLFKKAKGLAAYSATKPPNIQSRTKLLDMRITNQRKRLAGNFRFSKAFRHRHLPSNLGVQVARDSPVSLSATLSYSQYMNCWLTSNKILYILRNLIMNHALGWY